jgi:polyphenol oxidase
MIVPDWDAPARVRSLMSTRQAGDMAGDRARTKLRRFLPAEPLWLQQVHGTAVADLDDPGTLAKADAVITRVPNRVCAIQVADCMPVLLADRAATVVGAAHAGWRGLAAGILEATIRAMRVPGGELVAWLGPAIGPRAYEVGDEVRAAFMRQHAASISAFSPTRPGHWLLDMYAVARQLLARLGVQRVHGGGFCTYSDPARFFSYRRDRTSERMAAVLWIG